MDKIEAKKVIQKFKEHYDLSNMIFNEKAETFTFVSDNGDQSELDAEIVGYWTKDLKTIDEKVKLIESLAKKILLMQKKLASIEKNVDELCKNWT